MHCYYCELQIKEFEQERWVDLKVYKEDVPQIVVQCLKLKTNKLKKTLLKDVKNDMEVIITYSDNKYCMTIGASDLFLHSENLDLVTSFLLDCTEEYVRYNHIDFEISTGKVTTNMTISITEA